MVGISNVWNDMLAKGTAAGKWGFEGRSPPEAELIALGIRGGVWNYSFTFRILTRTAQD
jgi:hypothetical protein